MNMHPPALINKQVTEDMLHWIMMQPNTVTMNVTTNEFNVTPAKGAQDYPIEDNLRQLMLRELTMILAYNGFSSELLSDDKLKVSKDRWSMEIENILQQMPFPDYLPHQIEKAYQHHEYESRDAEYGNASYPSRERLESIRQTIIDNMEGDL
ncbi:MAG: hypothetical protein ACTH7L_01795 [Psychrobacter alimentarius]